MCQGGDPANTCLGHHQVNGGAHGDPGWGNGDDGVANAGYLDLVLCCGNGPPNSPTWFDDSSDPVYDGASWGEGVDFCSAQSMELCTYMSYCPEGGGSPPLGGTKGGDKWSPVGDRTNMWVQVGVWVRCIKTDRSWSPAALMGGQLLILSLLQYCCVHHERSAHHALLMSCRVATPPTPASDTTRLLAEPTATQAGDRPAPAMAS